MRRRKEDLADYSRASKYRILAARKRSSDESSEDSDSESGNIDSSQSDFSSSTSVSRSCSRDNSNAGETGLKFIL